MIRWQLSTPILGVVTFLYTGQDTLGSINSAIIANIIGSLLFFFIDLFIFSKGNLTTQWEVLENDKCHDCNKIGRLYRLALAPKYNRINNNPEFRCESCSVKKYNQLKNNGKI
jgi:hypothetical protein